MAFERKLHVVAVRTLIGTEIIDGGDTIAVRFEQPDESEMAVLIPFQSVPKLGRTLTAELEAMHRQRRGRRADQPSPVTIVDEANSHAPEFDRSGTILR